MAGHRRLRILALLVDGGEASLETKRLCHVCAAATETTGAGIMLMSGDVPRGSVCTTDDVSSVIEQLQYDLGEGPCVDAYRTQLPVFAPDLADPSETQWAGFRHGALAAGVRAAFGFPIWVGTVCIGALDLYQDAAGGLTEEQCADALVVASVAGRTVLGWQSVAGSGSLAWQLEHVPADRAVVHQAAGMASVQASVSVEDAMLLLRAYAFAEDRPISAVATDVVTRRLRFD